MGLTGTIQNRPIFYYQRAREGESEAEEEGGAKESYKKGKREQWREKQRDRGGRKN